MENKDKIFFGLVIICILAIAGLTFFMMDQKTQCIKNPFVYGASKMGDVSCQCQQYQEGSPTPAYFSFNDTIMDLSPKNNYYLIVKP